MEFLNVIAAAVAGWVFGAIWYMTLSKPWMDAAGLTEADVNQKDPLPYIVSFIGSIVVAGMLRHILVTGGITTIGSGLITGLGLGLFVVVPWMINTVLYGNRDRRLIWLDGGYPVIAMGIMGVVLTLF